MRAYKSKVDLVYENLLSGIENGVYEPGKRLVISQQRTTRAVKSLSGRRYAGWKAKDT